jgi:hypothetical protein
MSLSMWELRHGLKEPACRREAIFFLLNMGLCN